MTFTIPITPIGKPRMTQRDKWKKRPCVIEYRAFADTLRLFCAKMPRAEDIARFSVTARFAPPASWSAKKRAAAIGTMMRSKPDPDNILKAILDPLFADDSKIGDIGSVRRRWAERDELVIEIELEEP